jgi:sugar-specific transcriptional regulator TrmB
MSADDIAEELGVSKGKAYKLIRDLNQELVKNGFVVISGKLPRAYWEKKFYGYQTELATVNN